MRSDWSRDCCEDTGAALFPPLDFPATPATKPPCMPLLEPAVLQSSQSLMKSPTVPQAKTQKLDIKNSNSPYSPANPGERR